MTYLGSLAINFVLLMSATTWVEYMISMFMSR